MARVIGGAPGSRKARPCLPSRPVGGRAHDGLRSNSYLRICFAQDLQRSSERLSRIEQALASL